MITSLKKLLENKNIVSYEQYQSVKKEVLGRMFPDLRFKLTGNTVENGAKTYTEMEAYNEDLKVLRNEFPEYAKIDNEKSKRLRTYCGVKFKND